MNRSDISTNTDIQINRLIFASYETDVMNKLFCVYGDFYASETQDKEVTKSLQYKEFTATLTKQVWSIKNLLVHIYWYS